MKAFFLFLSLSAFAQLDKALHFTAGFVITEVTENICLRITDRPGLSKAIGFTAGVIAGGAKEYWDSKGHGQASLADFIWTDVGSACAVVIKIPIGRKRKKK